MPKAKEKEKVRRRPERTLSKEKQKRVKDSDSLRASNPNKTQGAKRQEEALTNAD